MDLGIVALLLWWLPSGRAVPKWGQFFEIAGKNPLFIYLLSELALITLYFIPIDGQSTWTYLYDHVFVNLGLQWGSFFMALTFALLCWAVGYGLHKKRIYIKV